MSGMDVQLKMRERQLTGWGQTRVEQAASVSHPFGVSSNAYSAGTAIPPSLCESPRPCPRPLGHYNELNRTAYF